MKIEVGKRYIKRGGGVSGVIVFNRSGDYLFVDSSTGIRYKEDGGVTDYESLADLV
jgi:hypothetical protein